MKKHFDPSGTIFFVLVCGLAMLQLSLGAPSSLTHETSCHSYIKYHLDALCIHGFNSLLVDGIYVRASYPTHRQNSDPDTFTDKVATNCCRRRCTLANFKQFCKPDPAESAN